MLSSSVTYSDAIICPEISPVTLEQQATSNLRDNMNTIRQMDHNHSKNHENRRWPPPLIMAVPDIASSTIPHHKNIPQCHNGIKTIGEVDIQDSAIRDMWISASVQGSM